MIFGKNAGLMLKYQKAKAKMVEYDVSKQEYPHFPLNSNELSYPTTYTDMYARETELCITS